MSRLFKTLPVLPLYNPASKAIPADGMSLKTSSFCKDKFGNTCKNFYANNQTEGFYLCPYGFAARAFVKNGRITFFTSLAVDSVSDLKKLRQGGRTPNPVLTKEFVDGCVDQVKTFQEIRSYFNDQKREKQHLADTIHEVRNFNSQLKANCDSHQIEYNKAISKPDRIILSNMAIGQMITSRLDYLVFNVNPSQSTKEKISLYKKVDKVMKTIRAEADLKQVKLETGGTSSFREMWAFSFIEQVPAILIQNAVKYAMPGTPVKVEISEGFTNLTLSVENTGPFIHEDERDKIYQKGYRGREARSSTSGTGTGLWFMKRVVEIHEGNISLKVGAPSEYSGIQTSTIRIEVKLSII